MWIDETSDRTRHALFHCNATLDVASKLTDAEARPEVCYFLQPWQQLYQRAVKEGPTLTITHIAKRVAKENLDGCKLPQLSSHLAQTTLDQGKHRVIQNIDKRKRTVVHCVDHRNSAPTEHGRFVVGFQARHNVTNLRGHKQTWFKNSTCFRCTSSCGYGTCT